MSKTLLYNLILTIIAIVVFIFIGASVYDAFTRNPVNRSTVDATGSSTVSGQIEAASPDATQPDQPTAANAPAPETAPAEQEKKQADAAYNQTNDPSQASATTTASNPASDNASVDSTPSDSGSSDSAADTAGAATTPPAASAPARSTPASPEPGSDSRSAGNAPATNNSNQPGVSAGSSPPATRSNPDLRAVIPPVPTAPPRAEGVPPPTQSDQDMYNATDSGADNGNISDSFPAPVSNFPAPTGSAGTSSGSNQSNSQSDSQSAFPAPSNTQGGNSDEQRRLEELRRQKEQLRKDLGF